MPFASIRTDVLLALPRGKVKGSLGSEHCEDLLRALDETPHAMRRSAWLSEIFRFCKHE